MRKRVDREALPVHYELEYLREAARSGRTPGSRLRKRARKLDQAERKAREGGA